MCKKFEDEYMELQASLISLCLELINNKVDKVYAYASIEEESRAFNAFYMVQGEILTLNQLGVNGKICMKFLKLGTEDLNKIVELCKKNNQPVPTEFKMIYDVNSGNYDADYKYNEICSEKTGICSGDVFDSWLKEKKEEIKEKMLD